MSEDEVLYYAHELRYHESQVDSAHETKDKYREMVRDGDTIVPGEEISKREFIRKCRDAEEVETSTSKQKHGADTLAPDRITDVVTCVETRAYPDGKPEAWR